MNKALRFFVPLVAFLCLISAATAIQNNAHGHSHDDFFACMKCDVASSHAGKCPKHGTLAKINAKPIFVCSSCKSTAVAAGNCPKCGKFMAKKARTYACAKCHTTAKINIKCSKCKGTMKEHVMPMKG